MSNIYIKGLQSGNVSISGDEGAPNVNVSINETESVPSGDVIGNDLFCDSCSTFITNGKIEVRLGSEAGRILTAPEMEAVKGGSLFDLDDDGVADQAEKAFGAIIDAIDATVVAESTSLLPGDGTNKFVPTAIMVLVTALDTFTSVATISVGTTTGGAEILAATALTGLDTLDEAIRIDIASAAVVAAIADNAEIFVNITAGAVATVQTFKVAVLGAVL